MKESLEMLQSTAVVIDEIIGHFSFLEILQNYQTYATLSGGKKDSGDELERC